MIFGSILVKIRVPIGGSSETKKEPGLREKSLVSLLVVALLSHPFPILGRVPGLKGRTPFIRWFYCRK